MKRVRSIIFSLAIIAALSLAFSFAKPSGEDCTFAPQYWRYEGGPSQPYIYAGVYGTDFFCEDGSGACTYWQDPHNGLWYQCRIGSLLRVYGLSSNGNSSSTPKN